MAVQRRPRTPGTLSNVTSSEIEYCVAGGFDIRVEIYRRRLQTNCWAFPLCQVFFTEWLQRNTRLKAPVDLWLV